MSEPALRLVTIAGTKPHGRPGVLMPGGEILDLMAAPRSLGESQWIPRSVVQILAAGTQGRDELSRMVQSAAGDRDAWQQANALLPAAGTELVNPLRRPGLLLLADAEGSLDSCAAKSPNSALAPGKPVRLPAGSDRVDYRAMIGFIFARPVSAGSGEDAVAALGAYTLLCDLGVHGSTDRWHRRQFPGACPMGPAAVLASGGDFYPGQTAVSFRLNSVPVWDGAHLPAREKVAVLVSQLARWHSFQPGDLVALAIPNEQSDDRGLHTGDQVSFTLGETLGLDFSIES